MGEECSTRARGGQRVPLSWGRVPCVPARSKKVELEGAGAGDAAAEGGTRGADEQTRRRRAVHLLELLLLLLGLLVLLSAGTAVVGSLKVGTTFWVHQSSVEIQPCRTTTPAVVGRRCRTPLLTPRATA